MSQNSSDKLRVRLLRLAAVVVLPIWTVGSVFVIGQSLVAVVVYGSLVQLGIDPTSLDSTLLVAALSVLTYLVGLGVLLAEPYAVRGMNGRRLRELLGVARRVRLSDAAVAVLGWAAYFIVIMMIIIVMTWLLPQFDSDQVQRIGFDTSGNTSDKLYALLTIVIAAPLVEEIVFRGYLQGSLRRFMPWWLGAGITSIIFGAVHGQWNVGIDTFVLSMVACYLRERTGAIWAGVGLHMIKNALAYYLLFWAPPWVMKLLGS